MKKITWSILILAVLLIPFPAFSQSATRLSNLVVDLWPEYDRPSVLVIYHATLAAETNLPTELTFRIPAAAGEPNAVAVRQPDGQLFSVDYETQISGEWELITFTATLPEIQLEYYDPGLIRKAAKKVTPTPGLAIMLLTKCSCRFSFPPVHLICRSLPVQLPR